MSIVPNLTIDELDFISKSNESLIINTNNDSTSIAICNQIQKIENSIVLSRNRNELLYVQGQTIHSFFEISYDFFEKSSKLSSFYNHKLSEKKIKLIKSIKAITIINFSIITIDEFNFIYIMLEKYGKHKRLIFGGIQLILICDKHSSLRKPNKKNISLHNFQKITDFQFIYLNKSNYNTDLNSTKFSSDILDFDYNLSLEYLLSYLGVIREIIITNDNQTANNINNELLKKNQSQEKIYTAITTGKFESKNLNIPFKLTLKIGAAVCLLRNDTNYRSGDVGQIVEMNEDNITIKISENNIIKIERVTYENITYYQPPNSKQIEVLVTGTFTQFPITMGWALPIHRLFGLNFKKVRVLMNLAESGYEIIKRVQNGIHLNNFCGFIENKIHDYGVDNLINNHFISNIPTLVGFLSATKFDEHGCENDNKLGDFYFSKFTDATILGDFNLAYYLLKKGLSIESCDCKLKILLSENEKQVLLALNKLPVNCLYCKFLFIKSISHTLIRLYRTRNKNYLDDPTINTSDILKTLSEGYDLPNNDLAKLYLARLNLNSDSDIKKSQAQNIFNELNEIYQEEEYLSTVEKYHLGRHFLEAYQTKSGYANDGDSKNEDDLETLRTAIHYLCNAFIENPTSDCLLRNFLEACSLEEPRIKLSINNDKFLVKLFNSGKYEDLCVWVMFLYQEKSIKLINNTHLNVEDAIKELTDSLTEQSYLFGYNWGIKQSWDDPDVINKNWGDAFENNSDALWNID